jgi:hypothetical protein
MPRRRSTALLLVPTRASGWALLAFALPILFARHTEALDLGDLLAGVAANDRFEAPVRADVHLTCAPACESAESRAVFLGKGETLYVEVQGGPRALFRPGEILTPEGGKAVVAKPGMAIGDPDVLLEDLAPFTVESLKLPQISDEGVAEVVVTAAPGHPSSYVLIVHTIDPEQRIIVKTQYYRDWVGNLVKMRRTADLVEVGGHRRPGTITIENFRRGTTTRLSLAWREAPDAPAVLFEPGGLLQPSGLGWPNGK